MAIDLNPDLLQLAHCPACGAYTFPATAPGCRVCGAAPDSLQAVPLPGTPLLQNFITLQAALAPGLPVPCVIGEVLLAPGVVEEALIAVADESALHIGQALACQPRPAPGDGAALGWQFVPLAAGTPAHTASTGATP